MQQRIRRVATALAVAYLLLVPAGAGADLLRCAGADGKLIYTDNKALCPGEKPFEPAGELQSGNPPAVPTPGAGVEPAPAPPSAREDPLQRRRERAEANQRAAEAEEAEARRWRDKQQQILDRIEALAARRAFLEKFVTHCNRGGYVVARDEAGIKRTIECEKIDAQYATLDDEEAAAQADLEALPEECRRAGCLPGWLR